MKDPDLSATAMRERPPGVAAQRQAGAASFVRPDPPYFAVIITSSLSGEDPEGCARMSEHMAELGQA